jgi:hypothetical protein
MHNKNTQVLHKTLMIKVYFILYFSSHSLAHSHACRKKRKTFALLFRILNIKKFVLQQKMGEEQKKIVSSIK